MREHSTKLIAFVMLLLGAALIWFVHSGPASAAQEEDTTVYLPFLPMRPQTPIGDLKLVHIGLFQSVQNQDNDVTLVARKPAVLRVFAEATHTNGNPIESSVTIDAYRNGQYLGSVSSPRLMVPNSSSAENLDSTFNVDLPVDWLEGKVVLTATIDQANAIVEMDESNNEIESAFVFRTVPVLELTIVPITYTDSVTGETFWEAGHDPISQWLLAAFPVSEVEVSIRAPFEFRGDLRQGDEWGRLLQELTDLWASEVGPGSAHLYYGLVPNSSPTGGSWFTGGISGLGWIGQRVSVGLEVGEGTGASAGHEIGHNFGRRHAPCGSASGLDPRYPYPNASIGVYGLDTIDETLHNPENSHDMMSYCGPEWVSDYTYEGLLQDQVARSNKSGGEHGNGLFISAMAGAAEGTLRQVRVLDRPIMTREGDSALQVQLLDSTGQVVATYPAERFEATEEGVAVEMLTAHIPAPIEALGVASVRFVESGSVVAEQPLVETGE